VGLHEASVCETVTVYIFFAIKKHGMKQLGRLRSKLVININIDKGKVKFSLCLSKYHAMKSNLVLN